MTTSYTKLDFDSWEELFDNYDIPELLKLQRKINKEVLRRLQEQEDR